MTVFEGWKDYFMMEDAEEYMDVNEDQAEYLIENGFIIEVLMGLKSGIIGYRVDNRI